MYKNESPNVSSKRKTQEPRDQFGNYFKCFLKAQERFNGEKERENYEVNGKKTRTEG